ncbi:hypothetical protein RB195_026086 [Necator americanus]|uniref:Uncharacterized protein n=1 Tax=Necator americanus TaxID=51031 RepID=A0ABR1EVB0_NECAM
MVQNKRQKKTKNEPKKDRRRVRETKNKNGTSDENPVPKQPRRKSSVVTTGGGNVEKRELRKRKPSSHSSCKFCTQHALEDLHARQKKKRRNYEKRGSRGKRSRKGQSEGRLSPVPPKRRRTARVTVNESNQECINPERENILVHANENDEEPDSESSDIMYLGSQRRRTPSDLDDEDSEESGSESSDIVYLGSQIRRSPPDVDDEDSEESESESSDIVYLGSQIRRSPSDADEEDSEETGSESSDVVFLGSYEVQSSSEPSHENSVDSESAPVDPDSREQISPINVVSDDDGAETDQMSSEPVEPSAEPNEISSISALSDENNNETVPKPTEPVEQNRNENNSSICAFPNKDTAESDSKSKKPVETESNEKIIRIIVDSDEEDEAETYPKSSEVVGAEINEKIALSDGNNEKTDPKSKEPVRAESNEKIIRIIVDSDEEDEEETYPKSSEVVGAEINEKIALSDGNNEKTGPKFKELVESDKNKQISSITLLSDETALESDPKSSGQLSSTTVCSGESNREVESDSNTLVGPSSREQYVPPLLSDDDIVVPEDPSLNVLWLADQPQNTISEMTFAELNANFNGINSSYIFGPEPRFLVPGRNSGEFDPGFAYSNWPVFNEQSTSSYVYPYENPLQLDLNPVVDAARKNNDEEAPNNA